MGNVKRRILFITILVVLVFGGIVASLLFIGKKERSFPDMPAGNYIGQISGIFEDGSRTQLLMRRIPSDNTLFVIIFRQGWQPQAVRLVPLGGKNVGAESLSQGLREAVALHSGESVILLSGTGGAGSYRGIVERENTKIGSWEVSFRTEQEVTRTENLFAKHNLEDWLKRKAEHTLRQVELSAATTQVQNQEEKLELLKFHIEDETTLQRRAAERKAELRAELERASKEHSQQVQEVRALVEELQLNHRIKPQGRIVTLGRNIAAREARWFLASWQEGQDAGLPAEEYLSNDSTVDVSKLDESYRRARELDILRKEVEAEKARIASLEEQLSQPVEAQEQRDKLYREERRREQRRKSFWERLF